MGLSVVLAFILACVCLWECVWLDSRVWFIVFDLIFQKRVLSAWVACFLCWQDRQKEGQGREEDSGQPGEGILGRPSAGGESEPKSGKRRKKRRVRWCNSVKMEMNQKEKEKKVWYLVRQILYLKRENSRCNATHCSAERADLLWEAESDLVSLIAIVAYEPCVSVELLYKATALYCVRTSADHTCWRNTVIWPTNTLCLLPPPTARLCQHHRDGHPQVPKREEPTQG